MVFGMTVVEYSFQVNRLKEIIPFFSPRVVGRTTLMMSLPIQSPWYYQYFNHNKLILDA
jgi:hypothetical protein